MHFIPEKLVIGFIKRGDTFNGELSYITYKTEDGSLKGEKNFDSWRDKDIEKIEIDNKPSKGIFLHKGIQHISRYSSGVPKVRVFDKRNFEYEITLDNLMEIIYCTTSVNGELEGEFVYGWNGQNVSLLAVGSEAYQKAIETTRLKNKKAKKITAKDLKEGVVYLDKYEKEFVCLGKRTYFVQEKEKYDAFRYVTKKEKVNIDRVKKNTNVFYDVENNQFVIDKTKDLVDYVSLEKDVNYKKYLDLFEKTTNGCEIKELKNTKFKNFNELYEVNEAEFKNPNLMKNYLKEKEKLTLLKIKDYYFQMSYKTLNKEMQHYNAASRIVVNLEILRISEDKKTLYVEKKLSTLGKNIEISKPNFFDNLNFKIEDLTEDYIVDKLENPDYEIDYTKLLTIYMLKESGYKTKEDILNLIEDCKIEYNCYDSINIYSFKKDLSEIIKPELFCSIVCVLNDEEETLITINI